MGILHTFLLVLVGSLGSLALEGLTGKAFVFPVATNTAHVVLEPTIQRPLTSFTVCMEVYTELTRAYSLFSYASKRDANEILLYFAKPYQYSFHVGGQSVIFNVPQKFSNSPGGEHVCASWESVTGLVELWVNGQPLVRKSLRRGYSVSAEASIILGQEQDSYGGGFDSNQSLVGEITNVYMWNRVLSPDEVVSAWQDHPRPGNLINWKLLSYDVVGNVFVKPALLSVRSALYNATI
uniref:C-reactive protein-like n=1 Tax=Euleptes europaea TaxID=460621 RepID=UPI00254258AB|nr:C-reactive protein-like [Euleptes europaea]